MLWTQCLSSSLQITGALPTCPLPAYAARQLQIGTLVPVCRLWYIGLQRKLAAGPSCANS